MIIIAIDGYSACGKSTLAKAMARHFNYRFIDTGAMYRAVTLYFLRHQIDLTDEDQVATALNDLEIDFKVAKEGAGKQADNQRSTNQNRVLLNGEDVEDEIRGLEVSNYVSPVATISSVRRALVEQQRKMGLRGGVVMDGRDIGTVVFPNAELKLFITADVETRVDRRLKELTESGKTATREEVRSNLLDRDRIDSSRDDSPLRQADDAILVDNSELSFAEFIATGIDLADRAIKRAN